MGEGGYVGEDDVGRDGGDRGEVEKRWDGSVRGGRRRVRKDSAGNGCSAKAKVGTRNMKEEGKERQCLQANEHPVPCVFLDA